MIQNIGKYYLYRHIRLDNNAPFYIGIGTKPKNATNSEYCRSTTHNSRSTYWKNITAKTKYEVEILLESDDYEFVKQKEIEFIALYKRIDCCEGILVNMTDGGDGTINRVCSEETRNKISITNTGRVLSPETIMKIIENRKSTLGYKHTEENKAKMSELKKGIKPSQESIDKRAETMKGWRNLRVAKEVHKYTLDGEYIESYMTMIDAKNECGCDVYNAVTGRNKTSGGFLWRNFKVDKLDLQTLSPNKN
jgi:hypothetical protein